MNVNELLDRCEKAYSENDYARTIEFCDEILKDDSNNQIALGYKAKSLYLADECEEALGLLDHAIELYPDNYRYLDIKSEVLMDKGQYAEALKCFSKIHEIGVRDESALAFIMMNHKICLKFMRDELIEAERYVDAFEYHSRLLEMESPGLNRPERIESFKRHVRKCTSNNKKRQYHVRISSEEAKAKLLSFLDENGFEGNGEGELLFVIDVVDKTYSPISAADDEVISESKFYDKVNYYPRNLIERRQLHDEDGNLVYEGYTLHNSPYGFGKAYFENGSLYREGIFDIKGIVQGKEYYPSGHLRFEGQWSLTRGYGPNAPCDGNAYDENGDLIFSGKFKIKRGGVGWPMIQDPKGFPAEQKHRPKIDYY